MAIIIINGLSAWPAFYVVGAEISSLRLRALSQSIGWSWGSFTTAAFSIFLPYIYNPGSGDLRGQTGFVYGGFCAIIFVVSWLYVPEVKGRDPQEIDRMFELGISSRQFKKFEGEE